MLDVEGRKRIGKQKHEHLSSANKNTRKTSIFYFPSRQPIASGSTAVVFDARVNVLLARVRRQQRADAKEYEERVQFLPDINDRVSGEMAVNMFRSVDGKKGSGSTSEMAEARADEDTVSSQDEDIVVYNTWHKSLLHPERQAKRFFSDMYFDIDELAFSVASEKSSMLGWAGEVATLEAPTGPRYLRVVVKQMKGRVVCRQTEEGWRLYGTGPVIMFSGNPELVE